MKITQPKVSTRNNKLYISFSINGKQKRKSLNLDDTKANRNFVQNKYIPELLIKVHTGEFFKNTNVPTVDKYQQRSFEIHKNNRRELTQKHYIQTYNLHIKPYFGNEKITKIKASDLALWQNKLIEKLSPKRVKSIRTIFNTIFVDAFKDEIISKNPFTLIDGPVSHDIREKIPFSQNEIFSILDGVDNKMKAYFAIGFFTGMRTGEIIGLKWSDINFKDKIIKVQRSRRQGTETLPKTKNSI